MGAEYDAYDQWCWHQAEEDAWLAKRPVCSCCEEHIQDDTCYEINDELICKHCLDVFFRKNVEDFIYVR